MVKFVKYFPLTIKLFIKVVKCHDDLFSVDESKIQNYLNPYILVCFQFFDVKMIYSIRL